MKDSIWQFPPLPEQRSIAGILSSLDDKIDLLHRQNKTLEGMAAALWRNACRRSRPELEDREIRGYCGN